MSLLGLLFFQNPLDNRETSKPDSLGANPFFWAFLDRTPSLPHTDSSILAFETHARKRAIPVSGLSVPVPLPPSQTLWGHPFRCLRFPPRQVSQALVRSFSSTTRNRFQNRVAEKQKLFQADNDLPVHLKGGGTDNILYRVTMGLCVGGTIYSLYFLGWASFPHQK